MLSVLSVVIDTETGRRLIFFLIPYTSNYKNYYGNDVGKHLEELLCCERDTCVIRRNVECTEDDGAEDAENRLPRGKYNESNAEPTDSIYNIFPPLV